MAITKTLVPDSADIWGKHRVESYDVALDTSYPTGGYSIPASSLGWSEITGVLNLGESGSTKGYHPVWDTANKKLMLFRSAGVTPAGTVAAPTFTGDALAAHRHTLHLNQADVVDGATTRVNAATNLIGANSGADIEIAGVADASGHGGIIDVTGGTPTGTNSAPAFTGTAVAAANLVQVSNAVNVSAVTVRLTFIGI